jgi:hypothetical protein
VLFAAIATFGAMVLLCRLGRWHSPLHDSGIMVEIVRDRYAVVVEADDPAYSEAELRSLLEETGCRDIRPLVDTDDDDGAIL